MLTLTQADQDLDDVACGCKKKPAVLERLVESKVLDLTRFSQFACRYAAAMHCSQLGRKTGSVGGGAGGFGGYLSSQKVS